MDISGLSPPARILEIRDLTDPAQMDAIPGAWESWDARPIEFESRHAATQTWTGQISSSSSETCHRHHAMARFAPSAERAMARSA